MTEINSNRILPALGIVVLLGGCATTADQQPLVDQPTPAQTEAPAGWTADGPALPGAPEDWLADLDSAVLDELVDEALERNYDLAGAAARVSAARAQATVVGADRLPQLDLDVNGQRNRTQLQGTGGGEPISITRNSFGLDIGVSWEADLWGRLGNRTRAAIADAEAAEADFLGARLSLAAQVARAWFAVIEAEQQRDLAQRVVDFFRDSESVIAQRYRSGISTALDLRLAREQTASAEASLAQSKRELDSAQRSFQVLLGRYPRAGLDIPSQLPELSRGVPAGLPSDLLERRPDLIAARQRLVASSERLRAANKNRLPSFRLTASGGTATDEFEQLVDFDSLVWSLFASLVQPIYQGERLSAQRVLAAADDREAWAAYAQAVLQAFQEVETALAAEVHFASQEEALARAAEESLEAATLALERYSQGLTDIITLLESQRRAVNSESSRLRTVRQRLENRINLYLALGGSFQAEPAAVVERSTAAGAPGRLAGVSGVGAP